MHDAPTCALEMPTRMTEHRIHAHVHDAPTCAISAEGSDAPTCAMASKAKRAFVAALWEAPSGQVEHVNLAEVLQLGVQLKRQHAHITRILMCTPTVFFDRSWRLLAGVWTMKLIQHLETKHRGCGERLKHVWTKLRVWDPSSYGSDHPDVVVFLDTDVHVRANIDDLFERVGHCEIAAVWRGGLRPHNYGTVRPTCTLLKLGSNEKAKGGGINAGVVVLKVDARTWKGMNIHLEHYEDVDCHGAEQDFLSIHFGSFCQNCKTHVKKGYTSCRCCGHVPYQLNSIGTIGMIYNFQIHQLALNGFQADEQSALFEVMDNPGSIRIVHFSAHPKPLDLVFGTLSEGSKRFNSKNQSVPNRDIAQEINGHSENSETHVDHRVEQFSQMTFQYHHGRCTEFKFLKFDPGDYKAKVEWSQNLSRTLIKEYVYEFLHGTMKSLVNSAMRQVQEQRCDCWTCRSAGPQFADICGLFRCDEISSVVSTKDLQIFSFNPWSTRVPGAVFHDRFCLILKILEKKISYCFQGMNSAETHR